MHASIRLGRVAGIEIGLHYSWFIIAALITLSVGAQFAATNVGWPPAEVWSAAVLTAVLFFGSIIAHELAHALVARAMLIRVRAITLFALGGVAQIESESSSAKGEFWMALAGPLASLGIGYLCLSVAWALGWRVADPGGGFGATVLGWIGYTNVALAVFNMIPGFPLDGGRVLRAIVWAASGNAASATRWASIVGQGVAIVFILLGLMQFFGGRNVGGLWLAFIGWFLLQASQASYAQLALTRALRDVRVRDIMSDDCVNVDAAEDVQRFVERVLHTGRRCFVVTRNSEPVGLVTPQEIRTVDRRDWPNTPVGQVMRPLGLIRTVGPETPASEALAVMARDDIHQLPVMANGRLEGILTRAHILEVIQTRSEMERR